MPSPDAWITEEDHLNLLTRGHATVGDRNLGNDIPLYMEPPVAYTLNDFGPMDVNWNNCMGQAIKALLYLAENERPAYGNSFPNTECCYMIADELLLSLNKLRAISEANGQPVVRCPPCKGRGQVHAGDWTTDGKCASCDGKGFFHA